MHKVGMVMDYLNFVAQGLHFLKYISANSCFYELFYFKIP